MKETAEFRVDEEFASLLFGPKEGERLGDSVRRISIPTTDPRYPEIGRLQKQLQQTHGRPFFYGWSIRRSYSPKELESASIFKFQIADCFEPAGEECGTQYDESFACAECGAGARQVSNLYIDTNRIPKRSDIARTIAGEIVVSHRFMDAYRQSGLKGAEFVPVFRLSNDKQPSDQWYQLRVSSVPLGIAAPTKVGIDPFDEDERMEYRCSRGDLIGLSLLSEVWLTNSAYDQADVIQSSQYLGTRRGLLRPNRILFVSHSFKRLLEEKKVKRFELEVAYLS